MSIDGDMIANYGLSNIQGRLAQVPMRDKTLSKDGYAADAKAVGEALASLRALMDDINARLLVLEAKE